MTHVMTYPEIVEASNNGSTIFEEVQLSDRIRPMKFDGYAFTGIGSKHYLLLEECDEEHCVNYNLYYRCWNEMPTDEEREKAKWKGDPYKFLSGEQ